jgi:glycosyltransferase involved in cell wall biosynthesis
MRVLHAGNTANNAYLNAKLMRRAGVEADALCDEWHILSQPEWEDAPLEGRFEPFEQLAGPAARVGWRRPDWVLSPAEWNPGYARQAAVRERVELAARLPRLVRLYRRLRAAYAPLRERQGSDLRFTDILYGWAWVNRLGRSLEPPQRLFGRYDVVQGYGPHPILPLLVGARPFVAFEHGTLREHPFKATPAGRLLALAYTQAARVLVTNADVIASAERLGLENTVFLPHPVDEDKYVTGPSELRGRLEAEGHDLVLLAPSRHDWEVKGTDRLLRAFAELVRRDRPSAVLVLSEWGLQLDRSRALIGELGIEGNVRWTPPLPKLRLIDAYRAADVVLDQFLIGTFGAVAPEAMACGRPVVMAFHPEVHTWCFPEPPPVVDARTAEDIYAALARLASDPVGREALGRQGREWVERYHGWRLVVDRQRAIYEEILDRPAA